jgi:hypothetical protein
MTAARVAQDVQFVRGVFLRLLNLLPSFEIADTAALPFGLKPHTRSVSWIVEQVITQQLQFHSFALGLTQVHFDMPDTSLHNCILVVGEKKYWVNVKIHDMSKRHSKSDIAAVEKLFNQYRDIPEYEVIYACFGIHFRNNVIEFDRDYLKLFSPQFLPIYINPRNDKIQALYDHTPELRSRTKFMDLLKSGSASIKLRG